MRDDSTCHLHTQQPSAHQRHRVSVPPRRPRRRGRPQRFDELNAISHVSEIVGASEAVIILPLDPRPA